jgi:UDP-2-acetamido-2-deoxy-ribo-hexuluronate aminotransferase
VFAQYTVFVKNREQVQAALKEMGVPTAVHYPVPMHRQPAYVHLSDAESCPLSDAAAASVMSLPMGADLDEETQDKIVAALLKAQK